MDITNEPVTFNSQVNLIDRSWIQKPRCWEQRRFCFNQKSPPAPMQVLCSRQARV